MNKLQMSVCALCAYVVLAGGIALFGSRSAIGQGPPPPPVKDVTVVNTPAQPVPTKAQGNTPVSGTVGIDPAGNAVTISGTPSVQVSSLPAVQISGTPTIKTISTAPKIFRMELSTFLGGNDSYTNTTSDLLVIEFLSGGPQKGQTFTLFIGGPYGPTYFFSGTYDSTGLALVTQLTKIYVQPGEKITLYSRSDCLVELSGHFEPN